jgi:hypothetical protein
VLREPRDRMFVDVVSEWFDHIKALWDPKKRAEVHARNAARMRPGSPYSALPAASVRASQSSVPARTGRASTQEMARLTGSQGAAVRKAAGQRDDILRWVGSLGKREKGVAAEIPEHANLLFGKIEALAAAVAALEREVAPGAAADVESEINNLEAQANPFDERASEERVRRLTHLKRQRRAIAVLEQKRDDAKEKLASCQLALENLRLDVVALRASGQSVQQITQVVEHARALASEVENAVYVADEMAKLKGGSRESGAGRR